MNSILRVIQKLTYFAFVGALIGSAIYTGWFSRIINELSSRVIVAYDVLGAGPATVLISFVGVILSAMLISILKA